MDYENFGIKEPIWDRFDFKPYFHNKLDYSDGELVKNLLSTTQEEFQLSEEKLEIIKKYQIRASQVKVEFNQQVYKKLALICQEFYEKLDPEASYRRLSTLKRFLEAICKTHHRKKPIDADYELMTDLILSILHSKKEYIRKSCGLAEEEEVSNNDPILEIIDKRKKNKTLVPIEDIISEAKKINITEKEVDEIVSKLKTNGDIFEVKSGFVKRF